MRYKTNLQEPTFRATFPIFNKYFLGLFALFALARILGKIEWSWWWVSAPIWGVWVIDLIYFVAVIVYSYQNRKTLQNIGTKLNRLNYLEEELNKRGINL